MYAQPEGAVECCKLEGIVVREASRPAEIDVDVIFAGAAEDVNVEQAGQLDRMVLVDAVEVDRILAAASQDVEVSGPSRMGSTPATTVCRYCSPRRPCTTTPMSYSPSSRNKTTWNGHPPVKLPENPVRRSPHSCFFSGVVHRYSVCSTPSSLETKRTVRSGRIPSMGNWCDTMRAPGLSFSS